MPNETIERDIAELRSKIDTETAAKATKLAAAQALVEAEKAAGRNPLTGTSDDDRDSFKRVDAAYKEADTHGENAAEYTRRLHRALDMVGGEAIVTAGGDPGHPAVARAQSMGALVVASKSYTDLLASGSLSQTEGAVVFPPVQVSTKDQARQFLATGRRDVIRNDVGDGNPLVPPDHRLTPPVEIPRRQPTLLDMITVLSTGRDAVTWTRQTSRTNAAATTPFGTPLPKSRYQWEKVTSAVIRKGHHAVVDEGNIADADEFQGLVNGELLDDLRLKIETDALLAAGGSDWTGILQASGIGSVDAALADTLADALHNAITVVRLALEREPTGWGINPTDFETYYLEKGTDGHYLHHRGPQEADVKTIWGLTAMVSTVYPKPVVAEWSKAATLWVREGISIAVDRIDDQFLEGLWTIRAQTRGAFAVKQPKAVCDVDNFLVAAP